MCLDLFGLGLNFGRYYARLKVVRLGHSLHEITKFLEQFVIVPVVLAVVAVILVDVG